MLRFCFEKKMRLLNSKQFQYVFSKPLKKSTSEICILGRLNFLRYPRLGLSISRKNIKYAYKRNVVKRLIRETFRLIQHTLISMDFIVIAKKNIIKLNNINIIHILENLWLYYRQ